MDILEEFKAGLFDHNLIELADYLHSFCQFQDHISLKKKFNVPFYYGKTWLYYLNLVDKKQRIELCFVRGKELPSKELLDFKKRTMVGGLIYSKKEEVDEGVLKLMLQEAVELDEIKPYTFKKKK